VEVVSKSLILLDNEANIRPAAEKKGFELNAVLSTVKPRCKVHWIRSEPCLSNPSASGRNLPVRTIAQSVRRLGIERGISIVTLAGFAAKHSC
jgi:hypothetical protein